MKTYYIDPLEMECCDPLEVHSTQDEYALRDKVYLFTRKELERLVVLLYEQDETGVQTPMGEFREMVNAHTLDEALAIVQKEAEEDLNNKGISND